ncbi:class I SAM-dependent RNA methyltransferase [Bifidobacterium gallicum]|uniref:RNA methyltransferase n=1 Tax=Bifidobacterium gallicum DSM 20093 = LMG 11596 TaxID=561180 RepID=D1NT25_9BIFI|nr:TRAM domain-containing protein [Bifidobacterium gallicum]EFA23827.1 tRNA (Uracil-5-)-methyltransferase [Bifidobacterium gallicum DSM 20093 = LMG 11596]KFI59176.1 RNA methyltransferase [Bifidobacterium gallicum DSM 20093 = LMG 11596]
MEKTLWIERYADQGRCVGHIEGRVVFVRFALPGELVNVTLDEPYNRDDRFWTGEVTQVLETSPDRVTPQWKLAGPLNDGGGLGGADLIHVSRDGQLKWKADVVKQQMHRLGHLDVDVPIEALPGDDETGGLHWRTRIELIADDQGKPSMRRRGSHVRVPIDDMPLASQALLSVARNERVWDGGFEPNQQIRIAVPEPRDVYVPPQPDLDWLAQVVGDNYAILVDGQVKAGKRNLTETIDVQGRTFTFTVDANGFWQMHRMAPQRLPEHVLYLVRLALQGKTDPVIWDLYSGSGLFTLPLAALAGAVNGADGTGARVLSVEGAPQAVKNARLNIKAAGLSNVTALCGDVAKTLHHVPAELAHPDVVVLDPPRAGAKAQVCRQIAASGAQAVVYIACDPASLARDTATLTEEGYELRDIRAFDLYPMTHHVETVALLTRVNEP